MDDELAQRIRAILSDDRNVAEVRMFGGICFTLNGHMLVVARGKGGLLARVGETGEEKALGTPGVERMVMRGRELSGYVTVPADALDEGSLRDWIALTKAYVATLPPKKPKVGRPKR